MGKVFSFEVFSFQEESVQESGSGRRPLP